jgi:hypothetical protein
MARESPQLLLTTTFRNDSEMSDPVTGTDSEDVPSSLFFNRLEKLGVLWVGVWHATPYGLRAGREPTLSPREELQTSLRFLVRRSICGRREVPTGVKVWVGGRVRVNFITENRSFGYRVLDRNNCYRGPMIHAPTSGVSSCSGVTLN